MMKPLIEIRIIGKLLHPERKLESFPFQFGMRIEAASIEIGSKPKTSPALILDYPGVSKRQAQVFLQDDKWHVEDMGSDNGTWLIEEGKLNLADTPKALNDIAQILFGVVVAEIRTIRE